MMISPEVYYKFNLKDKSEDELLKKIRSLKRKRNQLKRYLEEHSLEPESKLPSRLTQLKISREYLKRAVQAYEEAGGQYIPTKAEQKSLDFDAALESIQKLVLSIGGFFGGYETRTYTVSENGVILDVDHTLLLKAGNLLECGPLTKSEFIAGLKDLHIGEWKKFYNDPHVMDGTHWELEIYFNNGRRPVRISGINAFPYNFRELTEFLGFEWEDEEDEQDQD